MKIGVSGWRLTGETYGVKRYMQYLLAAAQAVAERDDQITLFAPEPLSDLDRAGFDRVAVRVCGPRLTNALWENFVLPRAAGAMDVLFGPSYTIPLRGATPAVVAMHSADEAGKLLPSPRVWQYELKYRMSARRACKVIANAQVVKSGIVECYGVDPDKVEVVYLAADAKFRPSRDSVRMQATRQRYVGIDRPYVLFVGGLSGRRNVPMLIRAFAKAKRAEGLPHALLLIGSNRAGVPVQELATEEGVRDSVFQIDGHFPDHTEIVSVYNAADVFVHPSSSEGFSLTLIEAMSCGTPVVTVNQAGLGEVAHGHAFTIEAPDVDLLTDALRRVLTDPVERATIGERCLRRAQDFTWEQTARKTLDIIRGAAG